MEVHFENKNLFKIWNEDEIRKLYESRRLFATTKNYTHLLTLVKILLKPMNNCSEGQKQNMHRHMMQHSQLYYLCYMEIKQLICWKKETVLNINDVEIWLLNDFQDLTIQVQQR